MTRTVLFSLALFLLALSPAVPAAEPASKAVKLIDEKLEATWKAVGVEASPPCGDHEFIRRAFLDLVGRIATTEEIDGFLRDPKQSRRARLIERLLGSEEYSRYWASLWTSWLLPRSAPFGRGDIALRLERWLEDQLAKDVPLDTLTRRLITARGKGADNPAVAFLLANLGQRLPQAKVKEEGMFDAFPLTGRIGRVFLGFNVRCIQCHDHPFDAQLRQADFWGLNAFLRQITVDGHRPEALTVGDSEAINTEGLLYEKRNGVQMMARPMFLGRKKPGPKAVRRDELARFVVESERFAPALVNRVWAQMFGRGLTHPFEDMTEWADGQHQNLLAGLSREFRESRHDLRALLRWVCRSRAYQLSASANRTNQGAEHDRLFSRMPVRPLNSLQLFASVVTATGASRALRDQLPAERERLFDLLAEEFEDDEGSHVFFLWSNVQALLLMKGEFVDQAIASDEGTLRKVVSRHRFAEGPTLRDLYLHTLNRPPSAEVSRRMTDDMKRARPDRDSLTGWQDLFWALLNSSEFATNH